MIGSVADQCWALELNKAPRASAAVQKLVLLAYASHASVEGLSIRPGPLRVAKHTGLNEDTVERVVKVLEAAGVLVRVGDPEPRKPTEWRLGDWFTPSPTWIAPRGGRRPPQGWPAAGTGGGQRPPEVKNLKGSLKKDDFSQNEGPKLEPEAIAEHAAAAKAAILERKRKRARERKVTP